MGGHGGGEAWACTQAPEEGGEAGLCAGPQGLSWHGSPDSKPVFAEGRGGVDSCKGGGLWQGGKAHGQQVAELDKAGAISH